MKTFRLKDCIFGEGFPKISVPIVGHTEEEILQHAKLIKSTTEFLEAKYNEAPRENASILKTDVIEFRADYYDKVCDNVRLIDLLTKLRVIFQNRILLFTYRSEEEGGELRHDRAENIIDDIYDWVISSGIVDMIDVELMSGNYRVVRTAAKAHDNGIAVIMSNHDFNKTPRDDELIKRFQDMEILGADILKIAAMPRNEFDVRRLMELTEKVSHGKLFEGNVSHPIVTMSMGEMGRISRISGDKTGSVMTFASVGTSSAPGQLGLEELFSEIAAKRKKTVF